MNGSNSDSKESYVSIAQFSEAMSIDKHQRQLKSINRIRNFSMLSACFLLLTGWLPLLPFIILGHVFSHRCEEKRAYRKAKFWAWLPIAPFLILIAILILQICITDF